MPVSAAKRIGVVGMSMGGVDGEIIHGLFAARGQRPWVFFFTGEQHDFSQMPHMEAKDMDAIVGRFQTPEHVEAIHRQGVPIIDFDGDLDDERLACICPDSQRVAELAADFLAGRGFERFGTYHIGVPEPMGQAFGDRLSARGLALHDRRTKMIPSIRAVIDQGQSYAILARSDRWAARLSSWLRTEDIQVPEQVAILGIGNDVLFCEGAFPALSSIATPNDQMGQLAVEWMLEWFNGLPFERRVAQLPPLGVVERGSTDFTAVRDPLITRSLQMIRELATSGLNVTGLVGALGVKRSTFDKRFTKATGHSPAEEIRRVRVEAARRRLLNTNDLIIKIAMDCGYSDSIHFTRHFQRAFGMTPSACRKAHQKSARQ
jgi:LacI family transcriptional regulator